MTPSDPRHHHRRSIRLPGYDYTRPGAYFITLVAAQRECLFGEIMAAEMVLNDFGSIVAETWQWLPAQYPYVLIGAWCVMPNHFHEIIMIDDSAHRGGSFGVDDGSFYRRGGSRPAPTGGPAPTGEPAPAGNAQNDSTPTGIIKIKPLGQLVGAFKTVSAKHINLARHTPAAPVWQRNYYEHIIRDENEYARIRLYIAANPANWQADEEYR